jgi:hypothetical protein
MKMIAFGSASPSKIGTKESTVKKMQQLTDRPESKQDPIVVKARK